MKNLFLLIALIFSSITLAQSEIINIRGKVIIMYHNDKQVFMESGSTLYLNIEITKEYFKVGDETYTDITTDIEDDTYTIVSTKDGNFGSLSIDLKEMSGMYIDGANSLIYEFTIENKDDN